MGSILVISDNKFIPADKFDKKCGECLDLLQSKSPNYYSWLLKYNLKIRAAEKSGANFKTGAIDIASETFNASNTWLASVFVHEAVHFWQFRVGKYEAGLKAESEANIYQMAVLKMIGAPESEILHMTKQDGTHADLNGDGVYDEKDYALRRY